MSCLSLIKGHTARTVIFGIAIWLGAGSVFAGYPGLRIDKINAEAGITLNEDISYPRGAKVYMQYGEVLARSQYLNEKEPYCYFSSRRSSEDLEFPIDIQATTFEILKLRNSGKHVSINPDLSRIQLVSFGGGAGDGGSATQMSLVTEFQINDPAQPHIDRLVCAVWADPRDRGWVSLDEMSSAMGEIVTIRSN